MIHHGRHLGMFVGLALGALTLGGCGTRTADAPKSIDGVAYGVTREPFRERWWQYCERGVSWANGGFWAEAEADLRQCLRLRRTDARRARTYGMHFVQCFAHRELGAVLIEQGRLDEAQTELETSMAQEPSAKAAYLLQRIRTLRGQAAVAANTPVVIDPTAPAVAAANPAESPVTPPPDLTAVESRIVIATATAQDGTTTVSGRFEAPAGTPLWFVPPTGAPTAITVDDQGGFSATVPDGAGLASGGGPAADGHIRPVTLLMTVEPLAAKPALTLSGPSDGSTIQASPAWFRFRGDSPRDLRSLVVYDAAGMKRGSAEMTGRQNGGMIAVTLSEGPQDLRFVLSDADGQCVEVPYRLTLTPSPVQDRRWRAPALLVALQPSGMGQRIRPRDPAYYERSVLHGERFNLVASEGAALQQQEIEWAQAGLVTPSTAVRVGRTVAARYVLLGTLTRGRDDAECFVRLVNCDTGQVVATTDAYDRAGDDFSTQAFFGALAARLRQAFPVHQSRLTSQGGRVTLALGSADGVCEGLRFHVLGDDRHQALGEVEVVACRAHDSDIRWLSTSPTPAPGLAISE